MNMHTSRRTRRTPHASLLSLAVAALVAVAACGAPGPDRDAAPVHSPAPMRWESATDSSAASREVDALAVCEIDAQPVTGVLAYADGVVLARAQLGPRGGLAEDGAKVLQRMQGVGCALEPAGAQLAARALLDVDDQGSVYVYSGDASETGVQSTKRPDESFGDAVIKVDRGGALSEVVSAARGIWGFGVAPAGDALWVTACGPTGIFAVGDDGLRTAMAAPETLWQQEPSVLTDAGTFWSVGVRPCLPPEEATDACGFALVRTTPAGSDEVGTTVMQFPSGGAGFEHATLSRCGDQVCGVFASAVVLWDGDGNVVRVIERAAVTRSPSETIASASGNRHGIYLLLHDDARTRIVFVAAR